VSSLKRRKASAVAKQLNENHVEICGSHPLSINISRAYNLILFFEVLRFPFSHLGPKNLTLAPKLGIFPRSYFFLGFGSLRYIYKL
jgi:hypothetical protein